MCFKIIFRFFQNSYVKTTSIYYANIISYIEVKHVTIYLVRKSYRKTKLLREQTFEL